MNGNSIKSWGLAEIAGLRLSGSKFPQQNQTNSRTSIVHPRFGYSIPELYRVFLPAARIPHPSRFRRILTPTQTFPKPQITVPHCQPSRRIAFPSHFSVRRKLISARRFPSTPASDPDADLDHLFNANTTSFRQVSAQEWVALFNQCQAGT